MINSIPKGKYVVAVSGGVDSVALLHSLHKLTLQPGSGVELIVAHFDHGIRQDSELDAQHVAKLAAELSLPVEVGRAELGSEASEELARMTRYNFLNIVKVKHSADSIITAHHQDDVLETAIINLARGTGRHGLSSLKSDQTLVRPILHLPKEEIVKYAKDNQLVWREDQTNQDTKHLRNHVRTNIVPRFTAEDRQRFLNILNKAHHLNQDIDNDLDQFVKYKSYRRGSRVYPRRWFNQLPHDLACSVVHHWLKQMGVKDYTKRQIEKLVFNIKVGKPGKRYDIDSKNLLELTKRSIRLLSREQTSRMVLHEAKKQ